MRTKRWYSPRIMNNLLRAYRYSVLIKERQWNRMNNAGKTTEAHHALGIVSGGGLGRLGWVVCD